MSSNCFEKSNGNRSVEKNLFVCPIRILVKGEYWWKSIILHTDNIDKFIDFSFETMKFATIMEAIKNKSVSD